LRSKSALAAVFPVAGSVQETADFVPAALQVKDFAVQTVVALSFAGDELLEGHRRTPFDIPLNYLIHL
jgi:hypothetical protein